MEFNAFIPNNLAAVVPIVNNPLENVSWFPDPNPFKGRFVGTDNRSEFGGVAKGTSRISTFAEFDTDAKPSLIEFTAQAGESHRIRAETKTHGRGHPFTYVYIANSLESKVSTDTGTVFEEYATAPGYFEMKYLASGAYPFDFLAPDIDMGITWNVCVSSDGAINVRVSGEHDKFPAYEAVANGQVIYSRYPDPGDSKSGPTLLNLNTSRTFDSGMQKIP